LECHSLKRLLDQFFGIRKTSGHQSTMDVVESVVIHPELFCIINYILQVGWNAREESASFRHTERSSCLQGGLSWAEIDTGHLAIWVLIRCYRQRESVAEAVSSYRNPWPRFQFRFRCQGRAWGLLEVPDVVFYTSNCTCDAGGLCKMFSNCLLQTDPTDSYPIDLVRAVQRQ